MTEYGGLNRVEKPLTSHIEHIRSGKVLTQLRWAHSLWIAGCSSVLNERRDEAVFGELESTKFSDEWNSDLEDKNYRSRFVLPTRADEGDTEESVLPFCRESINPFQVRLQF